MENNQRELANDANSYPARLNIDYPEKLNRLTTLLRVFYIIPILILLSILSGIAIKTSGDGSTALATGTGILFLPALIMILFRQKYPKWWFDWNLAFTRFHTRISSYLALLRDEYPSTDEEQAVHLELDYPDAKKLNRGLPLIKWFLAIPHWIILFALYVAALIVVIIAWFAILITGKYPKPLFDFVVGVMRWSLRVVAYALLLITDKYPPFSLKP